MNCKYAMQPTLNQVEVLLKLQYRKYQRIYHQKLSISLSDQSYWEFHSVHAIVPNLVQGKGNALAASTQSNKLLQQHHT